MRSDDNLDMRGIDQHGMDPEAVHCYPHWSIVKRQEGGKYMADMKTYRIPVYETVGTKREYVVYAESQGHAESAALRGDTYSEETVGLSEVIDRELL